MNKRMGVSPKFSFKFWDIYRFLKGRKKMVVTVLGTMLAYFITDDYTVSIVAGALTEMLFALAEYYLKEKHYQ